MPDNEQGQPQDQGGGDLFFESVDSGSVWQEAQGTPQGQPQNTPPSQDFLNEASGQQATLENPQNATPQAQQPQGDQGQQQGDESSLESKPVPEHMTPQQVYDMARYHQSRADQTRAEAQHLREEIEALKAANPIGQYAVQDPKFMAMISQYLAGGEEVAPGIGQGQQPTLQKPEPPKRPANLEPYSEEAEKYFQDLADYNIKLSEYTERLTSDRMSQMERFEEQQRQQVQQAQARHQMLQEAMYTYGLPQGDAEAFLGWAQDPARLSDMGLWVQAYKLDKSRQARANGQGGAGQRPVAGGQQMPATNLARQPQVPVTATAQPNASGQVPTEDPFFVSKDNQTPIW